MKSDTIAAIATAVSDSGIGIIRISGENAIEVHLYASAGGVHCNRYRAIAVLAAQRMDGKR